MQSSETEIVLSLAHSPDPDDAFMWWPITGKVAAPVMVGRLGERLEPAAVLEPPLLNGDGRFKFRAFPADIEVLNRIAVSQAHEGGAAPAGGFDITALSVRTWADVQDRYIITTCGASFGDGYGPKLVARATDSRVLCERCLDKPGLVIAIPGKGTTAFLMLRLLLRELQEQGIGSDDLAFSEMSFDRVMPAVAQGEADVGLVIHEGQLNFRDSGLCTIADVGEWWKERTGLQLPLGVNAVRRDLDERFGAGSLTEVAALLRQSVEVAMERWDESVEYALAFAEANARRSKGSEATLERVERYCRMYVTKETRDMGEEGLEAIRRLLVEGATGGLCPNVSEIEVV